MTKQPQQRILLLLLGGTGLVLLALAVLAFVQLWLPVDSRALTMVIGVGGGTAGVILIYATVLLVRRHFRALERLRGAVRHMADEGQRLPGLVAAHGLTAGAPPEIERLYEGILALAAQRAEAGAAPDQRLQAVLAGMTDAILVITDQGQVSLANHAAKERLGAARVAVGTSIFAALSRNYVTAAVERAAAAGAPVTLDLPTTDGADLTATVVALPDDSGAVLRFDAATTEHRAELDHDLSLHDVPPAPVALNNDCPLTALPALVLDTETTGLNVQADRIVSVGAVRLHGRRIYRGVCLDRLVDPGMAIPPRSTAIHGITDAMVADAGPFPDLFPTLRQHLDGVVLVGHNIPFDIAMLRRECRLAGLDWPAPVFLDTLTLAAMLDTDLPNLNLEQLAETYGVDVHGRHTALGDCLVTAEIYARMLARLDERGITTLGAALDFAAKAKTVVKRQKEAGW